MKLPIETTQKTTLATPAHKSVAKGIWYSLLGNVFAPLAALATAPMLAQALGVFGRGELAAATAPLLLASAIGTFGLPEAVTYLTSRFVQKAKSAVLRAGLLLLILGLASSAAVYLCAPLLSVDNDKLEGLIRITALAVAPTLLAAVPRALAAGFGNWKLIAAERALFGMLRLVIIGGLWMTHTLDPVSATIATLLLPLLSAVVLLPFTAERMRAIADGEKAETALMLGYGLRIWLGALSGIILTRVSQLVMVPLSNEQQLGLYAIAVTIGELPLIISGAVRDVVFSADANNSQDARLQQAARMAAMSTLVVSIPVGVTMTWWLPFLFGAGFLDAIIVSTIILAATVIGTTGSVAGAGLSARGRPGLRSWSMAIGAAVNLLVLILTVPALGAVGAAWATLLGNLVAGTGNVVLMKSRFGFEFWRFYGFRHEDAVQISNLLKHLLRRIGLKDRPGSSRHRS